MRYAHISLGIGLAILAYGLWYSATLGPCGTFGGTTLPPICIWTEQTFPAIVFLSGITITVLSYLLLRRKKSPGTIQPASEGPG